MQCEVCQTAEGTERSMCGRTVAVCDNCRDWLQVRMTYEENAVTRARLATSDPDSVIKAIKDLYAAYGHLDRDGWLCRTTRSELAFVLELNHRYTEALDELRQLALAFAHDPHGFVTNQLAIASVLNKSGRHHEAVAEIEHALTLRESIEPMALLGALVAYARIVDAHGLQMDPHYRDVVDATIAACGIPVPEHADSSHLKDLVLRANSINMSAQRRYRALILSLKSATDAVRARLLDEYLNAEPVGFYRELARETLSGESA